MACLHCVFTRRSSVSEWPSPGAVEGLYERLLCSPALGRGALGPLYPPPPPPPPGVPECLRPGAAQRHLWSGHSDARDQLCESQQRSGHIKKVRESEGKTWSKGMCEFFKASTFLFFFELVSFDLGCAVLFCSVQMPALIPPAVCACVCARVSSPLHCHSLQ